MFIIFPEESCNPGMLILPAGVPLNLKFHIRITGGGELGKYKDLRIFKN